MKTIKVQIVCLCVVFLFSCSSKKHIENSEDSEATKIHQEGINKGEQLKTTNQKHSQKFDKLITDGNETLQ